MGPRGPRPLARSACNYVWAGEGGRARSTRSRSSAWRTRVLRTGQFLFTKRISPTSCIATMAGCCIRYASMDPTSDRAFPYSLSPTQSDGQTPPFHSTKSLLNAASMRGFTNRMYAVSPLPLSSSALISTTVALVEGVAAKGDERRSVRRHRQEWRTQSMPIFEASRPRKTFLAQHVKANQALSLLCRIKQRALCSVTETSSR